MDKINNGGLPVLRRRQLLTGTAAMGLYGHALADIGFTGRMVTCDLDVEGHYVGQFVAANASAAGIIANDVAGLFGPHAWFNNTDIEDVRAVFGADRGPPTRTVGITVTGASDVQGTVRKALARVQADTGTLLSNANGLLMVITGPHEHMTISDLRAASKEVRQRVSADTTHSIWGMVADANLIDAMRVSLVASHGTWMTTKEDQRRIS